jgi:hypothetical protein
MKERDRKTMKERNGIKLIQRKKNTERHVDIEKILAGTERKIQIHI